MDSLNVRSSNIEKIVIRGANWLGDSIITIPAVRGLRKLFPSASLDMITPHNLADLWENERAIDRVIALDRPTHPREKLRLIRLLRSSRYDLGVLFPNSFESALWFFLGRVRTRLGYQRCGRGILLNRKVIADGKSGHQVYHYLNLVKSLGSFETDSTPSVRIPEELRLWANKLLQGSGAVIGSPVIGINPGSTYGKAKCWPSDRFSELIRLLRERLGAHIIIFGSPAERALAESLYRGTRRSVLNLAGETTVMQLAALAARCNAFVSNDTGPMHVACAVGTAVVAIIGPTDPAATGPLGESAIIRKRVNCAPCFERECPTDHRCMELIAVEEVFREVTRILKKPGSRNSESQTNPKY
jgi:heptosyltransferase-2